MLPTKEQLWDRHADFSTTARRQGDDRAMHLNGNNKQPRIVYPAKISFKIKVKFSKERKKEHATTDFHLKQILRYVSQKKIDYLEWNILDGRKIWGKKTVNMWLTQTHAI